VLGQVSVVVGALGVGEGHQKHVSALFEGHVFGFAIGVACHLVVVSRSCCLRRPFDISQNVPVALGKAAPMSWMAYLLGQFPASWLMKSGSRRYLRREALV
jgi:hypothetical protein